MSAESKKLATVSFITDTDVSYYEIGEVEGSFQKEVLKDYIKRFGHEKLCSQLTYLQYQVWDALREVNSEHDNESISTNSQPKYNKCVCGGNMMPTEDGLVCNICG